MMCHVQRDERGFAAAEMIAAVGLLLVPTIMFVSQLVKWPENQAMARSAAAEAAREVAVRAPAPADQNRLAEETAKRTADEYVDNGRRLITSVSTQVAGGRGACGRGATVTVTVQYRLPVMGVPMWIPENGGLGPIETERASERIDDYRSCG